MIIGVKIYDGAVIAGVGPWMDQETMLASFPIDGKDCAESSEPKENFFVDNELDQPPWQLPLNHTQPVAMIIQPQRLSINSDAVLIKIEIRQIAPMVSDSQWILPD